MNKKFILPISLMLLVGLAVIVSAIELNWGYSSSDLPIINTKVSLEKGWNLISGLANPEWITGGDISKNNIKVIYALDPLNKNYVQVYPSGDREKFNKLPNSNFMLSTAFWVYSDETGIVEYYTAQPEQINQRQMLTGWNFVGITSEMIGKSLNDIKGNCNIERAHIWYSGDNYWGTLSLDSKMDDLRVIGMAFVVKVSSDCTLGTSEETITPPPAIP